jgi:ABC-type sugar transport system permease subunit
MYAGPIALWFTLFFVAPLIIIVAYSFMKKGLYGGVEYEFSLAAYHALANRILLLLRFGPANLYYGNHSYYFNCPALRLLYGKKQEPDHFTASDNYPILDQLFSPGVCLDRHIGEQWFSERLAETDGFGQGLYSVSV